MKSYASYGAMVIVQLAYGGANILTKIALEKGLNQLVFVVYRHIIAMLLLGPFAYVLERLVILLMVSLQWCVCVRAPFFPLLRCKLSLERHMVSDHMPFRLMTSCWSIWEKKNLFIFFLQGRKNRPPLSFSVIAKIFLLSSLGTTIHLNVYYAGLAYTSPTVAIALSNVIPSLTFLIAVILRYYLSFPHIKCCYLLY